MMMIQPFHLLHRWSRWVSFKDVNTVKSVNPWTGEEIESAQGRIETRMQVRECFACGKTQVTKVDR